MHAPDQIDEQGFRIRRDQPTRVEAFVDAAFAFAVTLLVVSVGHVPESVAQLVQAMRGIPAFAASFLLIARFWQSHRQWSRRFGIEDDYSVRLSLALVLMILIYVYPLRMVASMTLASFSGGLLVEQVPTIASIIELRLLYVTFAVGYGIVLIIFTLLYRHALRCADALELSSRERAGARLAVARYLGFLAVTVTSLTLALALPMNQEQPLLYALPGMIYMLIWPYSLWLRQRSKLPRASDA